MKKTLITAAMLLFGINATVSAQNITVINSTSCDLKVFLFAEDMLNPCMGMEAIPFHIAPGGIQTYTSIFDIQNPGAGCLPVGGSGNGWFVPSNPYCPTGPGFWDAAFIIPYSMFGSTPYNVGEPCSGNPVIMTTPTGCGMGPVTVQWNNFAYPNITVKVF